MKRDRVKRKRATHVKNANKTYTAPAKGGSNWMVGMLVWGNFPVLSSVTPSSKWSKRTI